jgi:hypothetical protein
MVNKTDIRQDMNRGQIPAITCSQVPELPTITLTTFFNVHLSHYSNFQHLTEVPGIWMRSDSDFLLLNSDLGLKILTESELTQELKNLDENFFSMKNVNYNFSS